MARLAGSFLIRIWRTNRSQRFAIEHIQSGEKAVTTSATEAIDWVSARSDADTDDERDTTESSAGDELDRRYPGARRVALTVLLISPLIAPLFPEGVHLMYRSLT